MDHYRYFAAARRYLKKDISEKITWADIMTGFSRLKEYDYYYSISPTHIRICLNKFGVVIGGPDTVNISVNKEPKRACMAALGMFQELKFENKL